MHWSEEPHSRPSSQLHGGQRATVALEAVKGAVCLDWTGLGAASGWVGLQWMLEIPPVPLREAPRRTQPRDRHNRSTAS